MSDWKYTDTSMESAFRIDADGRYESWLVSALPEGTAIEPADPAPLPVPVSCTRRQGLRALLVFGFKRADIEAQIAAIEDATEREEAEIDYEANVWERANPRLQLMWAALGGEPARLDDLFHLAVTL